jgi:hypothetical protein
MRASNPFTFFTRLHLRELTGIRARTLGELLGHIREVPGSCIYHHTHHFLQRHQYLSPEPPNDFAYWISEALGEDRIAERLAAIDTLRFGTIRALREKIVETLEAAQRSSPGSFEKTAPEDAAFDFIKSVSVVFETHYRVATLAEFAEALSKVTVFSIYYHVFEARLRLEKPTNDFSLWLEESCGEKQLASQIAKLDPYTHTMEGLRTKIIRLIEKRLAP